VLLAEDRRSVLLNVPGLAAGTIAHVRVLDALHSDGGRELWTREGWVTLNVSAPGNDMWPNPPASVAGLTDAQRAAGWRARCAGQPPAGGHDHAAPPADGHFAPVKGWAVKDGVLERIGGGGDLVSDEVFGDFELELDWRIAADGNSGIIFLVDE